MQFLRYAFAAFCLWIIGWIPSVTLCILYYHYIFRNYFVSIAEFWPIWQDPTILMILFLSAAIFLIANILHFISITYIAKILILWCERTSPTKELSGVSKKSEIYHVEIEIHHLRGFILRFVRFYMSKSFFPWWISWAFNQIGVTRYGIGTVLEDQFFPFEMVSTGSDVYIGTRSIVSSQLYEGNYGGMTIAPVHIEEKSVIGSACAISPGVRIGTQTQILSFSAAIKYAQLENRSRYDGIPLKNVGYFKGDQ